MTTSSCAGNMSATHRKDLGIQMLSGTESVSHLAARQGVSRKFAYRQACKADAALTEAFTPCVKDDDVLFYIPVTKAWLKQLTLALILICHSSYRGVVELLGDLLDVTICAGTVHNWLHEAPVRPWPSIAHRICRQFASVCTMKSSRSRNRYWSVSMRRRPIAIFWRVRNIGMPTHGVCTCWRPVRKDSIQTTRSPMRAQDCGPANGKLWATSLAMAMSFISSTNAKRWPICPRALRRAPRHNARSWT